MFLIRTEKRFRPLVRFAALPFPRPVEQLQVVPRCRLQIPGVQRLARAVDVLDGEVQAAFGFAEDAGAGGQWGDGGFLGAARLFERAHFGFHFGQEGGGDAQGERWAACSLAKASLMFMSLQVAATLVSR